MGKLSTRKIKLYKIGHCQNFSVERVVKEGNQVIGIEGREAGSKNQGTFFSGIVVGADGSTSKVALTTGLDPIVQERHALCARAYFEGVDSEKNSVELHYLKGVCPGYFWIFPVDNGLCNVGVGVPSADLEKRGQRAEDLL